MHPLVLVFRQISWRDRAIASQVSKVRLTRLGSATRSVYHLQGKQCSRKLLMGDFLYLQE